MEDRGQPRLHPKSRSLRAVADELQEGGKGPHVSTVRGRVNAMVGRTVKFLNGVGMKSIGHVCSTGEIVEEVAGKRSCVSTVADYLTRFWLSAFVSISRNGQNASGQFREAKEMTRRDPLVTRSDSLSAIARGHREVYGDVVCAIPVELRPHTQPMARQQPARAVQRHPARVAVRQKGPPDRGRGDGRVAAL